MTNLFLAIRRALCAVARGQGRRHLARFEAACRQVERVQRQVLGEILAQQAQSEMGRALGFGSIGDPETFRRRIALASYEDHSPWINRMRDTGDTRVMFGPRERLLLYALTSGTESEPKHIPVTAESYRRYRNGWTTWVAATLQDHPRSLDHKVLPIVSPAIETHTVRGVPCGSMSGLSTQSQSCFVKMIYAIPPPIYGLSNQADKYYALARWGAAQRVSFLVTANPSSSLMLAQAMETHAERLIRDVHDGTLSADLRGESQAVRRAVGALRPDPARARWLEKVLSMTGSLRPQHVWPELRIITNWKGGTLGHYLDLYPEHFGATPVRDIGLLASEGRMTIPMDDQGSAGPLDLFSHFYEFIPIEEESSRQPTTLLAHELEIGRQYLIVLTNFSGLHRYMISDVVAVEGLFHRCPVVRFLHKGSRFSSITGEKISEHQATIAVRGAAAEVGLHLCDFMLVPVWGQPPCYALLAGARSLGERPGWGRLLEAVDRHLQHHNIEYASKRKSGRLGPPRLGIVDDNLFNDMRLERIATSGGRSEQYKPTYLTGDLEFHKTLTILEEVSLGGESKTEPLLQR